MVVACICCMQRRVNCLSLNRMIASGKIHLPDVKEIKRANTG